MIYGLCEARGASDKTVGKLLRQLGYSLQAAKKMVEGKQHPDRNAQFEHIDATAKECIERSVSFISVDTKKKELVGNFANAGVEWQPKDTPELVDVHDFPGDAIGKAIPYGIYDVAAPRAPPADRDDRRTCDSPSNPRGAA